MKLTSLLTGAIFTSMLTVASIPLQTAIPPQNTALAQSMSKPDAMMKKPDAMKKEAMGLNTQQKIAKLSEVKGKKGSGDLMRSYFAGDLEPIGIQPGGAGMVVNFYNKANNLTVSYCSTFDVVVAVKQGKIAKFAANEVK